MAVVEQTRETEARYQIITHGSTWRAIWHISWPLVLNMAIISVAAITDVWVAGKLGFEAQAALGFGGQIWNLIMMLAVALAAATTALVSRFWGAGEKLEAVEAARHSLLFAFCFGTASTIVGLVFGRPLLRFLGATGTVEEMGWQYMRLDLLTQIPWNLVWVANSIFRARGETKVPMFTWSLITTMIVTCDFVFCLHPFHFGMTGLAMSAMFGSTLGCAVTLFLLRKSELGEALSFRGHLGWHKSTDWCKRILRIGLPACVQDLAWLAGNFFFFIVFAKTAHPAACQAAWTVGIRLEEMLAGMPIYALAMGVGTIVGQNLGAQQPERAEKAGWQVAIIGAVINTFFGAVMFFGAGTIATMMTSGEPMVVQYTKRFLEVLGPAEPFVALWLLLFGAMAGAGYTKWPMWATTICMLAFRLPLAWVLTVQLHLVPNGAWIAMASTAVILGLLGIWQFRKGLWKYQKI
jgi:putative MATE family efflux protein